jgi:hypothetical protein
MSPRGAGAQADVLSGLALLAQKRVEAGATFTCELVDGDLVAEVTVKVRRRVGPAERRTYIEGAMAVLRAAPARSLRCRVGKVCHHKVRVAVVSRDWSGTPLSYQFVCASHGRNDKHGVSPWAVLGVVELPRKELGVIQAEAERAAAERRETEQREQAEAFAAAVALFQDPAGVPDGWTYCAPADRSPFWRLERGLGVRLYVALLNSSVAPLVSWWITGPKSADGMFPNNRDVTSARAEAFAACEKAAAQEGQ